MKTPLKPCPHCGHPGHVVPAVKRGLFIGECSETINCDLWPMTEPKASEEEAANAWNASEFAQASQPTPANAE